jgi:hypothetical protein
MGKKKEAEDVTKMMVVDLLLHLGESLNKEKGKFDGMSLKDKIGVFKKLAEARKALDGVDVAVQLNQLTQQISKEEALKYLDGLDNGSIGIDKGDAVS